MSLHPVVPILFASALTVLTCVFLGRIALRPVAERLTLLERNALSFPLGAAFLSILVLCLGVLRLANPTAFGTVAALAAIGFLRYGRGSPARPSGPPLSLAPVPWPWLAAFAMAAAVFGTLYFRVALAPEHSPDGMSYHLGLIAKYAREGAITATPASMFAMLGQGVDMLFLFAYVFGRHSAAALVHLAFLVSLCALLVCAGRRWAKPETGVAAAILVLAAPVVGVDAATAYVDVGLACAALAFFYLLLLWEDLDPAFNFAALAGVCAGFCFSVKYSAALAVPAGLLVLLFMPRHSLSRQRRLQLAAVLLLGATAIAGPWLLRNALWYSNPLAPFYNALFPNPFIHVSFELYLREDLKNWGHLSSRWQIPMEVTVRGLWLQGFFGPVFLLAPLALWALRYPLGRRLFAAAAVFGGLYWANPGTRYLIPVVPFLAMGMALALQRLPIVLMVLCAVHSISSYPTMTPRYCHPYAWRLPEISWPEALRQVPEREFLANHVAEWPVIDFLNQHLSPRDRVFVLTGLPESYLERDIIAGPRSALGEKLRDSLWMAHFEGNSPATVFQVDFPPTPIREFEARYAGGDSSADIGIAELRLDHPAGEAVSIPPDAVTAHPFPWDAPLIVDGSLGTRWRTWQPTRASGQIYLRISLPDEVTVSRVTATLANEHGGANLKWTLRKADGTTIELPEHTKTVLPEPAQPVRRPAINALRALGITHIAIADTDPLAGDFKERSAEWGIQPIFAQGGWIVYSLNAP